MSQAINIDINCSPTISEFVDSRAKEVLIVGPRREGKSTGGVIAMTHHAQRQPSNVRPIPWMIVRDTFENLKNTTLKAIMTSPLAPVLKLSNGNKHLEHPGFWTAELVGIDSLGDMSKLQGAGLGGVWFEECAPAAEQDVGNGIQEDAYSIAQTSLSHPCEHRSQITENYPDEDHWTWERFVTNPIQDSAIFEIPRFENPHLQEGIRENMERALINRPDLRERLVYGRPGMVMLGTAVTPEFNMAFHVAKERLLPVPHGDIIMGEDFGLNPTFTIMQISPLGNLLVLDCIAGDNIDLRRHIEQSVKPLLFQKYSWIPQNYVHIPDPNCNERGQATGVTAYEILVNELPGIVHFAAQWPHSRDMVKQALNRRHGETMWVQIDPYSCKPLIKALRGGWHYPKNQGQVLRDNPLKDRHSHPADSFAGAVGIISGDYQALLAQRRKPRNRRQRVLRVAGDIQR